MLYLTKFIWLLSRVGGGIGPMKPSNRYCLSNIAVLIPTEPLKVLKDKRRKLMFKPLLLGKRLFCCKTILWKRGNIVKKNLKALLEKKILTLDGAMGTMLQAKGLTLGTSPELLNLTQPNWLEEIHKAYVEAGAEIIQTNTFGANALKLAEYNLEGQLKEINRAAVKIAKKAAGDKALVAASVGPLGQLLEPLGKLTFWETYTIFKEQVRVLEDAGADIISIETMSDLQEARAALLAVKENTKLSVFCQMTFADGKRTLTGTDPATAVTVLEAMGADVVGANCSTGPEELVEVISAMRKVSNGFLVVQPNAGLPQLIDGKTVFLATPEEMGYYAPRLVEAGANIIGGCCGTQPKHIKAMVEALKGVKPGLRASKPTGRLASRTKTIFIDNQLPPLVIGERINPSANQHLAEELRESKMITLRQEAELQIKAGADLLDVNVGTPGIDEKAAMGRAVILLQSVSDLPLVIDSSDIAALEAGLANYSGKALLNSVNGKEESLASVLPLAKKYGAAIIGLTLGAEGIPKTAEGRVEIARKIMERALAEGIAKEDIYIDCLVLTASTEQAGTLETLEAIWKVKKELGLKTVSGMSNISYGLPRRDLLNGAFLAMGIGIGLDLAILDPLSSSQDILRAAAVLANRDLAAQDYIKTYGNQKELVETISSTAISIEQQIREAVVNGNKENISTLLKDALLRGQEPMNIINTLLLPAMEEVGEKYEDGIFFLPQLMLAAETMKIAFESLKPHLEEGEGLKTLGTIVLATVKGDIHDIGKNIVAVVLENYGFKVVDLGKDVDKKRIVEAVKKEKADLVGLSALMTTTLSEMEEVISELKAQGITIPVLVGGAVVTQSYGDKIGATYARDAVDAVAKAKFLLNYSK